MGICAGMRVAAPAALHARGGSASQRDLITALTPTVRVSDQLGCVNSRSFACGESLGYGEPGLWRAAPARGYGEPGLWRAAPARVAEAWVGGFPLGGSPLGGSPWTAPPGRAAAAWASDSRPSGSRPGFGERLPPGRLPPGLWRAAPPWAAPARALASGSRRAAAPPAARHGRGGCLRLLHCGHKPVQVVSGVPSEAAPDPAGDHLSRSAAPSPEARSTRERSHEMRTPSR